MKKLISLVLALAMMLAVSVSFAMTLEPEKDDNHRLAGATVHASVAGYNSDNKTFTLRVYDYDRYDDDDVARLAVGDAILAGGYVYTITGVKDMDGTRVFLCDGEEIYFERSYDGDDDLIALTIMDDRIFMNVVTVLHLRATDGIIYEDASDPNPDAKSQIVEGLEAILKVLSEKEEKSIGMDAYATTVTLNDRLEIVKIHQAYDVAQ